MIWDTAREEYLQRCKTLIDAAFESRPVTLARASKLDLLRLCHATPCYVTVQPGDLLYLPSLWVHQVAQSGAPRTAWSVSSSCSEPQEVVEDHLTVAVNWWFDMQFDGRWAAHQMLMKLSE